jgi:site-specific DNA-methyltransferase (adenine-specific)
MRQPIAPSYIYVSSKGDVSIPGRDKLLRRGDGSKKKYRNNIACAIQLANKTGVALQERDDNGKFGSIIYAPRLLTYKPEERNIQNIDCFEGMKNIADSSIDLILTDPPYFIEGMGDDWDKDKLAGKRYKETTVSSLPGGMKFDPEQGKKIQKFSNEIGKEYFRVLKPGGFLLSFSQARLYHRMTVGFEECGFEIRDMLGWTYEGQAKAFTQDHFIDKMDIAETAKEELKKNLGGRKTPQLKPMIEPICLGQKPKEGTNVENWVKYGVGLIDVSQKWNDKFPGNLIACPKPSKAEKGQKNDHLTVKPIKLIEHLIKIFSKEGDLILDPFLGSGTTAVAALSNNRRIVGFEINKHYFQTIKERTSIV